MKRLHYVQHVPFETPGSILDWARGQKIEVTSTKIYEGGKFPDVSDINCLVVMGGPMGVYEETEHPWIRDEKVFIEKAIKAEKSVLAVCLGAQLLACILGSKVTKNRYKEIGWYPIQTIHDGANEIFNFLPDRLTVFHWHGDTFELPRGAVRIAKSDGCENQGYIFNKRLIGLQFHLEVTKESLMEMAENGKKELVRDVFIQSKEEIMSDVGHIEANNSFMAKILSYLKQLS